LCGGGTSWITKGGGQFVTNMFKIQSKAGDPKKPKGKKQTQSETNHQRPLRSTQNRKLL